MAKKLSPTQEQLLLRVWRSDINLVRLPGGFWTAPGTPMKKAPLDVPVPDGCGVPIWYYPTNTVRSLISRGHLRGLTHSKFGPTKVEITAAGIQVCIDTQRELQRAG